MAEERPSSRVRSMQGESGRQPSSRNPWLGMAPDFVRAVAADRLKALGHPDRLRIVEALAAGPMNVSEIAASVRMPNATVSRHLRVLADAEVVRCSRRGSFVLYVLADRDVARLALVAYRGAGSQAQRRLTITRRDSRLRHP